MAREEHDLDSSFNFRTGRHKSDRDWAEDQNHENGSYQCRCTGCGRDLGRAAIEQIGTSTTMRALCGPCFDSRLPTTPDRADPRDRMED